MSSAAIDGGATRDLRGGKGPCPVLLVDDEVVVRDFLARCLEGVGHSVEHAGSAAEALALMRNTPFPIVLCDIRMPGPDGLWLLERIRAEWPDVQVVMTTAIDDLQTMRDAHARGAAGYITKPIKPAELLEAIEQASSSTMQASANQDGAGASEAELASEDEVRVEAEYTLETPLRCPGCGERIGALKAVRLVRARVNFTSTLPRRGRVLACPHCLAIVPAELTNF